MKLGLKNAIGLFVAYLVLMAAFAVAMREWLSSLEEGLTRETVRLLAREQANLVFERSLATLEFPDDDSRRRLTDRIKDLTLLSEVVSSVTVVDPAGVVVASDTLVAGTQLAAASSLFGDRLQIKVEARLPDALFQGGQYTALIPLTDGGRLAGYLRLQLHSERLDALYARGRAGVARLALLGLAGVGALGVLLQIQLSRRAASITAALGGPPPPRHPLFRGGDEFAQALQAANRVREDLERARRQSQRWSLQVGALADVLKVGIVLLRRDLEVDFASDRALDLLGGRDEAGLVPRWDDVRRALREAVRQAGPVRSFTARLPASPPRREVAAEVYRLGAEEGDDYLVLLSDPQVLEAVEADALLASRLEGLGRVYRTMAHELKAPLSAMMINLDLLRESLAERADLEAPGAGPPQRYVEVLRGELDRLNRSLHGILTQTVPDSQPRTFDLIAALKELAQLLDAQARRQGVSLELRVGDEPLPLAGYPDRLRQALLNVVVNALEAMPKGGRLSLEARARDGDAELVFRDTGPGIPPELLDRIYDMDFSTKREGSGIGLSVARALVELHGGAIRVESAVGRGTDVSISLPLPPGSR
jgi:signal transduction histidine kinase